MTESCHAILIEAPDAPGYDELPDGTAAARAALPPRFHIPVWNDLGNPKTWVCAVCWGDSWGTSWPCETARQRGGEIFASGQELARYRAAVDGTT